MKIHYGEELENATLKTLESINKGLLITALQLRDSARSKFVNNSRGYKIGRFQNTIQVGKLNKTDHRICIHGMGLRNDQYDVYKGRFFITGSKWREQTKINGKKLNNPRNIGRITGLNTLDNILPEANIKLQNNIRKSIELATKG